MSLQNDRELLGTKQKLKLIEQQIEIARARDASPENAESVHALVTMANQMREEILRYEARQRRQAS
jgi:hypothetical protein